MTTNSPFVTFGTNTNLENDGVWLSFGTFQIKTARAGGANARFERASDLHFKEHRRAADAGVLPDDIAIRQLILVYADAVILDWRTVKADGTFTEHTIVGADGNPVEFSRDNVIKLLTATKTTLFPLIRRHAESFNAFTNAEAEADLGN